MFIRYISAYTVLFLNLQLYGFITMFITYVLAYTLHTLLMFQIKFQFTIIILLICLSNFLSCFPKDLL